MADAAIQRTFAGGELAPALHGRADMTKYQTGLKTCKNFIVRRSGGVANRPGLRLVNECKTASIAVKLMRYVSEIAGESILIECGVNYFRFFKNGGAIVLESADAYDAGAEYAIGDVVKDGGYYYYAVQAGQGESLGDPDFWSQMGSGGILEIPHPFGNSLCNYHQNGRVITLTSGAGVVPPHELIYVSLTKWILRPVDTKPGIEPPATVTSSAGSAGTRTLKYRVTAGAKDSYEESVASGTSTLASAGDPTVQAPHTIEWDAVEGASEYYVYCDPYGNGTFGFIGTATGQTTFKDVGFTADFSITPPLVREPFKDAGNYPRQSASYQQRRFFANSINDPDAIWGSRTGFISNFNISSPLQNDDAVTFKIAGNQHNPVRHMVGLKALIVLTDAGVHSVTGGGTGEPITPSQLSAEQETYVGVSPDVNPVVIGNAVLYVQARGAIVCDLRFDQQVEGFAGRDLTLFAQHLFDGYTIQDIDYQQTPDSTLWCCRSDGTLLGLTYLRDEGMWGWHRHTTGLAGRIEHVCVVPEQDEDVLYVITRRTINGAYHRFIERLERRDIFSYNEDSYFVDCGLSYSGGAAKTFSGLDHLEGQRVAVLADGEVMATGYETTGGQVVSGGAITLPGKADGSGYTRVHIGLPIPNPEIETLDLDVHGTSLRDRKKKVASVAMLLDNSTRSFYVGPDAANLVPFKLLPYEGMEAPWTGRAEQSIISRFNESGRILVRHFDPVPLTILSVMPHVEQGG